MISGDSETRFTAPDLPRVAAKSEPFEHALDLMLAVVAAAGLEGRLQFAILSQCSITARGHRGFEFTHAGLDSVVFATAAHDEFANARPHRHGRHLFAVCNPKVLAGITGAAFGLVRPGEDSRHRGLAGPIVANYADAVALVDSERQAIEDRIGAEVAHDLVEVHEGHGGRGG
jgi:hypothetical protein